MSDNRCSRGGEDKEDILAGGNSTRETCPRCGNKARSVPRTTVYHMLEPVVVREVKPDGQYRVCSTRNCPVVYYGGTESNCFFHEDLRVRVGFKLPEDDPPHPVCYCFGFTEQTIAGEIERSGESTVVEWITRRVQAGECACEYRNPTGRCCLADVREVVEKLVSSRTQSSGDG